MRVVLSFALVFMLVGCSAGTTVNLPASTPGIGFDDLRFSARLGRVLVPAGRSGSLDLVDPGSLAVTAVGGFSASPAYDGGHDFGVTSADDTGTWILATDRTAGQLDVVDGAAIVSSAPLASGPDYVRWVAPTAEAWVTEPSAEQIEVFSFQGTTPTAVATIRVAGGPESLVIDARRGRAYTHLWAGATVAIDLATRAIVATWPNGCAGSRGIALDEERGFLLVGCAEGKATLLDVADGKQLGEIWPVDGMDVIDYDPLRHHLYLAGRWSANVAIVGVSSRGELGLLGHVDGAVGAHCVVTDGAGRIFVCDPAGGRLLVREDRYPAVTR